MSLLAVMLAGLTVAAAAAAVASYAVWDVQVPPGSRRGLSRSVSSIHCAPGAAGLGMQAGTAACRQTHSRPPASGRGMLSCLGMWPLRRLQQLFGEVGGGMDSAGREPRGHTHRLAGHPASPIDCLPPGSRDSRRHASLLVNEATLTTLPHQHKLHIKKCPAGACRA